MAEATRFHETNLWSTPIRDLGLTDRGHPAGADRGRVREPSSSGRGHRRLQPRLYLSTEWGVPFETIAIAIPFYLARPDLTALQAERVGHVEGFNRADILRYLRHEMGHVVNYAYRLYERRGVGQAVRVDHPAVRGGVPARAVQPPVRASPAGVVRPEAPGRGLGGDVRGVDDAGARLADGVRRLAGGVRPSWRTASGSMAELRDAEPVVTATELDEDVGEHRVFGGAVLPATTRPARRACRRGSTARSRRSSRTWDDRRPMRWTSRCAGGGADPRGSSRS